MKLLFNWQVRTAILLIAISVFLYIIFGVTYHVEPDHIFEEVFSHVAFLPMHVLIITLIIHGLLNAREKRTMLNKLNIVIGTFYGEVGLELIRLLMAFDINPDGVSSGLEVTQDWKDRDFAAARKKVGSIRIDTDASIGDLEGLCSFLSEKQWFILRLLENPNLLEHDAFTDMLWAVSHLTDELKHRKDLKKLPKSDYGHLSGDIKRAYIALIQEWLPYMKHLKDKYPYLFSLAVRSNPFDKAASIIVDEG